VQRRSIGGFLFVDEAGLGSVRRGHPVRRRHRMGQNHQVSDEECPR